MSKNYVWYAFSNNAFDRKYLLEALAKKMNVRHKEFTLLFEISGTAEQLANLLEMSEEQIVKLSHLAMSTIREC